MLRNFGPDGLLRPTKLGNILLATDAYPMRCYGMDGSLFWVHVETLVETDLRDDIQGQRLQLETALAWISTEPSPPNGGRVKQF